MNLKHSDVRSENCTECGKICTSEWGLELHKMKAHSGQENQRKQWSYKCQHCVKTFSSKCSLLRHKNKYNTKKKFSKCKVCGKEFPSISKMRRHFVKYCSSKSTKSENISTEGIEFDNEIDTSLQKTENGPKLPILYDAFESQSEVGNHVTSVDVQENSKPTLAYPRSDLDQVNLKLMKKSDSKEEKNTEAMNNEIDPDNEVHIEFKLINGQPVNDPLIIEPRVIKSDSFELDPLEIDY